MDVMKPTLSNYSLILTPRRSSSHIPTFSARHPMIPKLYVMPWKQDMKNQRLLIKNAALAGIPVVPLEESLCFCGREMLHNNLSGYQEIIEELIRNNLVVN
uniref:Uncharacterized protein n=1 Tax=Sparus aurata TaxID=8175 RepID=A0A671URE9_SPAAU